MVLEPSPLVSAAQLWAYTSPPGALAGQYWPVPATTTELGVEAEATAAALHNLMAQSLSMGA
ncbi:MAG: hypothetical protein HC929_03005 [Leptolyngbyaceae cyanobacterium SM2_5_2]|nr:hypothetical protein [Leptolyngbyaceae cyanobacterium SM2_5_2]